MHPRRLVGSVFYRLASVETEHPDPDPAVFGGVKGVDLGERYLAVTATPDGKVQASRGMPVRHQGEAFPRVRSRLQAKGTRGAKRRLAAWPRERDGLRRT